MFRIMSISDSTILNLGIVGCGTIAQIKHIPNAVEIEGVRLIALCDTSQYRVETLGDRYGVRHRFGDPSRMIDELNAQLDGVIVCTPSYTHADIGTSLIEADIPVLMEKPLALTVEGAEQLATADQQSNAPAMVGYMKRYTDAYQRFSSEVQKMDGIDFVSALDVDPAHRKLNGEMYNLVDARLPEDQETKFEKNRIEAAKRAIGTNDDMLANGYYFRLEHACHDLDLLRSLFGTDVTIEHVDIFNDATNLRTILDFDGVNCAITEGWSQKQQFEQWIRVDNEFGTTRIDFTNSFLRNSFTEVTTKYGDEETKYIGSLKDSFRAELEYFIKTITGEAEVLTSFDSAVEDVRLMRDIFQTYG